MDSLLDSAFESLPMEGAKRNPLDDAFESLPFEGQAKEGSFIPETAKGIAGGATTATASAIKGLAGQQELAKADRTQMITRAIDAIEKIKAGQDPNEVRGKLSDWDADQFVVSYLDQQSAKDKEDVLTGLKKMAGLNLAKPVQETELYQTGKAVQEWGEDKFRAAKDYENTWSRTITEGLGSTVPIFATTVLSRGTAFAGGSMMSTGEAIDRAIKAGATKEQILQAVNLGGVPGLTESLPFDTLLNKVPLPAMGKVMNAIVKVGATVLAEGGQEGLQQAMQNLITKYVYKPDQDVLEGVGEAMVVGGIVGGIISAPTAPFTAEDTRKPAAPPPPASGEVVPPGAEPATTVLPPEEVEPTTTPQQPGVAVTPDVVTPAVTQKVGDAVAIPDSPRLTTADRKSPIPNDLIDEGKQATEAATGQPSTFTTTTVVDGQRQVVTGNVADLVAKDRVETAALIERITAGVAPPAIAPTATPAGPLATTEAAPGTIAPTALEPSARPSIATGGPVDSSGFKRGPGGYRYRVSKIGATGGIALEKRSEGGRASTFYIGADGNIIDADNVVLNDPDSVARVWKPQSPEAAAAAMELMDEWGATPLNSPERAGLKQRLKDIVNGTAVPQPASPASAAAAPATIAPTTAPAAPAPSMAAETPMPSFSISARGEQTPLSEAPPGTPPAPSVTTPAAGRQTYRADWRGSRQGQVDPKYFDVVEDTLADDNGEVIARKDKLVAKPNLVDRIPATAEPGVVYRGISADDYANIQKTGQIVSSGDYNMSSQKGLTYYGTDPQIAESYANSFAPAQYKPTFDKPAYVIAVRMPPADKIRNVPGTGSNEVGVIGSLPASDIVAVYRGDVAAYDPGVKERGVTVAPSARLHWQKVEAPSTEPAAQKALKDKVAAKRAAAPQPAPPASAAEVPGRVGPTEAEAAPRAPDETDKAFAKRVVDKRPEPKALPEKYEDYFLMDKATVVPIGDLVSSKTDEENAQGGGNAAKRMEAAAKGELSKRDPITVERRADGKYLIKDGNGTYTSVKGYGWKSMPVIVEGAAPAAMPRFQVADAHKTSFTGETATPEQRARFSRHSYTTIDALYEDAQARQDELGAAGKEIADRIEGISFTNPGLKTREKSTKKIGIKGYDDAGQITDAIRGGFHVNEPGQASQIIRALASHFEVLDEGWIATQQGYFDRKALVRFADGHIGEVQFWEPHVFQAKEFGLPGIVGGQKGHDIYDEWNTLRKNDPSNLKLDKLNQQMNELYAHALSLASDRAWAIVLSEGRLSKPAPKYLNLLRQTSSSKMPQVAYTSPKSASTQSVSPGWSSALASKSVKTTGRSSQVQNFTGTPPSDNNVVRTAPAVKGETPKFAARLVGQGSVGATGTGGKGGDRVTIADVARKFHEQHMASEGRQLFPETEAADYTHVLNDMAAPELASQMEQKRSGVGWYSQDTADAIDITSQLFPTLATDPEHRDLFLIYAGIFGNGPDPITAWLAAGEAFDLFMRTGEIPVSRSEATKKAGLPVKESRFKDKKTGEMKTQPTGWTQRNAANEQQIALFKNIVERLGSITAAMRWLTHMQPRSEINQAMRDAGYTNVRYPTAKDLQGPDEYGALVFGPKLGRYVLGLNGIELTSEDATVDKWFVRTYRRWTGRLFEGPLDDSGVTGQPDPKGKGIERRTIFRMVDDLAQKFRLKPVDVQAVLWFHEQRLYDASGVPTEAGTNTDGAQKLLEQRGVQYDVNARSNAKSDRSGRKDESRRGGAAQFVSPNVAEGGGIAEALQGLDGARQQALREASREIDGALGMKSRRLDAIGAWSDGAENTVVSVISGNESWEKIKLSSAMKGHLADQKAVLIFKEEEGGTSALYRMRVPETDVQKLHANLIEDGVAFHTIVPHNSDTEIIVADLDGSAQAAVAKAAGRYNVEYNAEVGQAEFIGTTKEDGTAREQRDDARRAYEEVIRRSPVQGGQELWSRLLDTYGQTLGLDATRFKAERARTTEPAKGRTETREVEGGVIHYALSPQFAPKAEAFFADLRKALDKFGLTGVKLNVWEMIFADLRGGALSVQGQYARNLIDIAVRFGDPNVTMSHEVIHALFELALTANEKAILLRKSVKDWITPEIKENYAGFSNEVRAEEGVAYAFTNWEAGERMDGMIARSFKRIKTFLKELLRVLTKYDIRTADDIFRQIQSGKIGRRTQEAERASTQPGESMFQIAWHGSKAKFRQFSQEFFGQGQGDSRYGAGFYFARGVDRAYAATFGDNVYEVDIPETQDMLDWGEKLTNQPKGVQEKLEPLWEELGERVPNNYDQNIYHWIGQQLLGKDAPFLDRQAATSAKLDALGIPGAIFERRGQNGAVVFNAENIEILSVNGEQLAPDAPKAEHQVGVEAPRFMLHQPPPSQQQAQQVMQGFIARGQPVDRAIRVPFALLGGIDKQSNRLKLGKRLTDKMRPAGLQGAAIGGTIGTAIGALGGPLGIGIGAAAGATVGAYILGSSPYVTTGQFGWFKNFGENAKRGLIDNYGLDPDYVETYRQSDLGKASILREAQGIMKVLENAGVGTAEAKVLQQILSGKPVNDADMIRVSEPIRKAIDDMGAEAVSLGLISAESFERNRGAYLHRVYTKNEVDQGTLAGWVSTKMAGRRKKIIGDQLKGRGIFWDITPERLMQDFGFYPKPTQGQKVRVLDRMNAAGDKASKRVYWPANRKVPVEFSGNNWVDRGEWEVRRISDKEVTLWRDYTEEERGKMGELVDARYTIAKTFMLMANDLSTGRFYRDVAANPEWTSDTEPASEWREASEYSQHWNDSNIQWVHVPNTAISKTGGKKRWGALADKYVRAEIWRDLNELQIASTPNVWRKLLTQWKLNKTARNPVVHMNNIMSNMIFMDLADIRMQDLAAGLKAYIKGDTDFQEAVDNGAFGSDMVAQEIRKEVLEPILEEITKAQTGMRNPVLAKAGALGKFADGVWTWVKNRDADMLKAYQMEDEVFRMAAYMRRRSQGESPKVAALNARDQFLNYDIRAPWIRMMRNSLFPFISYTYRAIPKLMENILHRPWKLAKYVAIAYAVNALGYLWDDDDDEERERAALRNEEQGNTWLGVPGWFAVPRMIRMPFRDAHGLPVFLDVRRWIPAGDIFDVTQGSSAVPLPSPLHFGGPIQMAFELMLNKKAFDGEEITNSLTDTPMEKAAKVGDWAWKSWAPASFWTPYSWYWTKIGNAVYGATDTAGRPYSLPQAALSSLGIKVKPLDVDDAVKWHYLDFRKVQMELKQQFRSNAQRLERGLISQSAHDAAAARILEKASNLGQKVQEFGEKIRKSEREPVE